MNYKDGFIHTDQALVASGLFKVSGMEQDLEIKNVTGMRKYLV